MNKKLFFGLLALIFVFTACGPHEQESFLNLEKGKTYTLNQEVYLSASQEVMDSVQQIETRYTIPFSFQLIDQTEGVYNLEGTYNNLIIEVWMLGQTYKVNALQPDPSDPVAQLFGEIPGKKFNMKIDRQGNVLSVDGINNVFNSLLANTDSLSPELKMQFQQLSEVFSNEKDFKSSLDVLFTIPGNTAYEGMDFTDSINFYNQKAVYQAIQHAKVDKYDADVLAITDSIEIIKRSFKVNEGGLPGTVTMEGKAKSHYELDAISRWPKSVAQNWVFDGRMFIPKGYISPNDLTIKLKYVMKTKITN